MPDIDGAQLWTGSLSKHAWEVQCETDPKAWWGRRARCGRVVWGQGSDGGGARTDGRLSSGGILSEAFSLTGGSPFV